MGGGGRAGEGVEGMSSGWRRRGGGLGLGDTARRILALSSVPVTIARPSAIVTISGVAVLLPFSGPRMLPSASAIIVPVTMARPSAIVTISGVADLVPFSRTRMLPSASALIPLGIVTTSIGAPVLVSVGVITR